MRKLIAALALVAGAAPALADVGVSIRVGEPGFYGQIELGNGFHGYRPGVIYSQPVVIERRYRHLAPIYVHAPREHYKHWSRYCGRYSACGRPAYFVRDDWYRNVYVPRYRHVHSRDWRHDRDHGHHRGHDRRDHDRRDYRGGRG